MFNLHHSRQTRCFTTSRAPRSESKQDGAELTTSDPSHQNVTNLHHKSSNHLTSVVFLLQTLSPSNNVTSLSTASPKTFVVCRLKALGKPLPSNLEVTVNKQLFTGLGGFTCKWYPRPLRHFSAFHEAQEARHIIPKHTSFLCSLLKKKNNVAKDVSEWKTLLTFVSWELIFKVAISK